MNAIGAAILVAVILTVASAPRRWALLGFMAGVLYLTQGQQVTVLGFNLYAVRFIELAAYIRVMARKEFSFSWLNGIDRALLLLYAWSTVMFLLRSTCIADVPIGLAYQIGLAADAFFCYFAFRGLIGDMEDLRWFLRAFTILLAPYVVLILIESLGGHNPFSSMGGVDLTNWSREGRPRCNGSFRHPSLLGTLGGSFFPLYIGMACVRGERKSAFFGIALCLLIIWASNSGAPINCAAIAIIGWLFWPMRTRMKLIRRVTAVIVLLLAMVMKAPIWYLPAKASSFTGGDGWHRSYLMDIAFKNLGKWWLAGMPIQDTWNWFPYGIAATGGADITNQFLSFGISSGLGAMLLFFLLLIIAFKKLGMALAAVRSTYYGRNESEFLLWGLGVMLTVHFFNWLGIIYYDQTYVIWFMQLATISSLSERAGHSDGSEAPDEEPESENYPDTCQAAGVEFGY